MTLKKILIVDDEKPLTNALGQKFKESGFEVTVVYSGKSALEACEAENFDLALLDILMPGIDGWEVLKEFKKKNLKTIVISNLSQGEDMKKARELGALDFIVKSNMSLSEIVDNVSQSL